MTILQSLILGLVEGLTEFIPVSSTFHIIATSRLLSLPQTDLLKLFEVVIQGGAILSILALYGHKLKSSLPLRRLLLFSFIPTALIGGGLYKIIKDVFFEAYSLQLSIFVGVGVIFLLIEWAVKHHHLTLTRSYTTMTPAHAVMIGLFQSLSVVPGVSRSGAILAGMLVLGYTRPSAAEYAFLLSLPTILAATGLDLVKNASLLATLTPTDTFVMLVGVLAAFVASTWVMRWLIRYLSNHTLSIFSYYRFVLTLILLQLL